MLLARPCRLACTLACALLASACGGPAKKTTPARTELSARDIVQRFKPAIVRIENTMGSQVGVGTGFLVSESGRIATNLHVIAGGGVLKVRLSDGSEHAVPRVVAVDMERDLAIIEIDAPTKMPVLPLGDSDIVEPGDTVIAIGNPMLLDFTVSDGLISSVRKVEEDVILQISAPISQGSSGGPLFNSYGEVIGVATLVMTEGQNLNFGVPINYLRPLLAHDGSESIAEFSKRFQGPEHRGPETIKTDAGVIQREVPNHDEAMLDGCDKEQMAKVFTGVTRAIELGAPLYNDGDHEACYNIYKQTATHFEKDKTLCKKLRDAFGDGMLKAETKNDATAKAWAMRDTFDGLLSVIVRKAKSMP